jgi:hypothetical protein
VKLLALHVLTFFNQVLAVVHSAHNSDKAVLSNLWTCCTTLVGYVWKHGQNKEDWASTTKCVKNHFNEAKIPWISGPFDWLISSNVNPTASWGKTSHESVSET